MADAAENRVAVYIDFDNIVMSRYDEVHGRERFRADKMRSVGTSLPTSDPALVDIGAIIDYATSFGNVVISKAFADWSAPANASYQRQLVGRAVDLTQLFPTASYQKNGADIRLSVDVVEDMFRLPDITHVVIVAGDSDFIPLAQRCRRLGRYVVGIGVDGSTSASLAATCDEFKYYGTLPGVLPVPPKPEPAETRAATKGAAAAKTPPAPKAKQSPELEVVEPADTKLAPDALLVRAMQLGQRKATDEEWLYSSSVKSQMMRMDPSFDEKSLGFKSFTDFVRSVDSQVEIEPGPPPTRIKLRESVAPTD